MAKLTIVILRAMRNLARHIMPALLAAAVLAAALAAAVSSTRAGVLSQAVQDAEQAHPHALWHVVHDLCLTDHAASGAAAPCAEVNLKAGYAVVRDFEHVTHFLVVPTVRVPGIESPSLLAKGSPNYWQAAWTARALVQKRLGRPVPREDIALAINSVDSRTQDQLHIHVDCVRPDIRAALLAQAPRLGVHWTVLHGALFDDGRFRARWIGGLDLNGADPFKLLARADPRARADMRDESLLVAGAERAGRPGFIVLAHHDAPPQHIVAAESFLDDSCAVLGGPRNT